MKPSSISNAPDSRLLGAPPDNCITRQCLLDFVPVFSEKDLIALGVSRQCATALGFHYAKEVATLPSPFVQNAFLYFFWFVDRSLHLLRSHNIPKSKLRCQLLYLAARKSCQHVQASASIPVDVTPTPRVRTKSSMRKQCIIKSPSLPDMVAHEPYIVEKPQPAESNQAEVGNAERHENPIETPSDTKSVESDNTVEKATSPVTTSTNTDKKNKKRTRVEARAQASSSTESSGTVTPKRKQKQKTAPVYEQRLRQEALETGIRVKEVVRKYTPLGSEPVTSVTLLSLMNTEDFVGNLAVVELLKTNNLCDETSCVANVADVDAELMQAIEIVLRDPNGSFIQSIPPGLLADAHAVIEVFQSCKKHCPISLFITMLQRKK